MIEAGLLCVGIFCFSRLYIKKFDISNKNIICIAIAVSVTGLLNLIQLILKTILDFIF